MVYIYYVYMYIYIHYIYPQTPFNDKYCISSEIFDRKRSLIILTTVNLYKKHKLFSTKVIYKKKVDK